MDNETFNRLIECAKLGVHDAKDALSYWSQQISREERRRNEESQARDVAPNTVTAGGFVFTKNTAAK